MEELDLKPNSRKFKEEQANEDKKRANKVVTGKVRTKKKSAIRNFADVFVVEDAENVKSYVVSDVIVPTIKNTILEVVRMFMFGGRGGDRARTSTPFASSKVSYRSFYGGAEPPPRQKYSADSVSKFDYEDLVFETYGEADNVLEHMDNILKEYGVVTVMDMYDLADISAPYTCDRYGWTDIHTAKVVRALGGGYMIDLPKATPVRRN
jgi:hypothetical protein